MAAVAPSIRAGKGCDWSRSIAAATRPMAVVGGGIDECPPGPSARTAIVA